MHITFVTIMDTIKDSKIPTIRTFVFLKIGTSFGNPNVPIKKTGPDYPEVQRMCMLFRTWEEIIQEIDIGKVREKDIKFDFPEEISKHEIKVLLEAQERPVCLVAHTGNTFHFPLLMNVLGDPEASIILKEMLFIDSEELFDSMYPCEKGTGTRTLETRYTELVKGKELGSRVESNCYKLQHIFNMAPEETIANCDEKKKTYEEMFSNWQEHVKKGMKE